MGTNSCFTLVSYKQQNAMNLKFSLTCICINIYMLILLCLRLEFEQQIFLFYFLYLLSLFESFNTLISVHLEWWQQFYLKKLSLHKITSKMHASLIH